MNDDNIYLSNYSYARALVTQYRHVTAKLADTLSLTVGQLNTLCTLTPGKSIPMKDICTILSCDASKVTGLADQLVQKDLIFREDCPTDRRVKTIRLSKKGEELRTRALKQLELSDTYRLSHLSDNEKRQLSSLLKKAIVTNGEL